MAQYLYACEQPGCKAEFEAEHPMSQPAGAKCPKCGAVSTKRLIGKTTFALKGGGWYKDGY